MAMEMDEFGIPAKEDQEAVKESQRMIESFVSSKHMREMILQHMGYIMVKLYKYLCTHYTYKNKKNILKRTKKLGCCCQKRANTSAVGKSNNYYEDIYIPPYNNTH